MSVSIAGTNRSLIRRIVLPDSTTVLSSRVNIEERLSAVPLSDKQRRPVRLEESCDTYKTRLKSGEEATGCTMAFHLERSAGFQFKADQLVEVDGAPSKSWRAAPIGVSVNITSISARRRGSDPRCFVSFPKERRQELIETRIGEETTYEHCCGVTRVHVQTDRSQGGCRRLP